MKTINHLKLNNTVKYFQLIFPSRKNKMRNIIFATIKLNSERDIETLNNKEGS